MLQNLIWRFPVMVGALVVGLSYSWGFYFLVRWAKRGQNYRRIFIAAIPVWMVLGLAFRYETYIRTHPLFFCSTALVACMHSFLLVAPRLEQEFPEP